MSEYYELSQVLLEELKAIEEERGERGARGDAYYVPAGETKDARFADVVPKLHKAKLTALCLSGGGIRSATFSLGVLQGLARNGILKQIDFLSTVSGGGYIGSWLSSWISRAGGSSSERVAQVSRILAQESPDARCNEPCQVKFLREYSNYLTPRVGIFSLDTWAIIGTYLRNLLLNWLVLIPLFFALFLIPRMIVAVPCGALPWPGGEDLLLAAAALFGMVAIAYAVVDLPSIGNRKHGKRLFLAFFLVPLFLMACTIAPYWGIVYRPGCPAPGWQPFVRFALVVHVGGWLAGMLWLLAKRVAVPWSSVLKYSLCAAATGVVAGALGWVAATKLVPVLLGGVRYPRLLYATVSVPVILTIYLLTGALVVAWLSRTTRDEDREWWGRAAGIVILAGLVWGAALAAVIYGPYFLLPDSGELWQKIYAAVAAGAGVASASFGKNSSTPAMRPGEYMSKYRTTLLAVGAAIFLLFLAQCLSLLMTVVLWMRRASGGSIPCLPDFLICCDPFPTAAASRHLDFDRHLEMLCRTSLGEVALIAGVSVTLSILMAWAVNVNTFSMHAMYRNRLVRCYLGASRVEEERNPNWFTGFDEKDNLPMKDLPRRPYHVVNMAWNLVKGKRLAWQQRKAASFIMSPLFAGSDIDAPTSGKRRPGGFRNMAEYGAGRVAATRTPLTVGTAVAISGAAASPNMGYHSSPLVTFVMALFNVRLGWWLGNPGKGMRGAWRMSSPGLSVRPLLKETLGLTNEKSSDIYLSDGGHFENLALYEMVRRRCRYIVVCDAGCDCDASFSDLGNAVRKVRADFGLEIELDLSGILEKKSHFAVGSVRYSLCDGAGEDGVLLYIKPLLTGDEPVDEFNYRKMHPEFPHESTGDQWFDEAQFESYRKLGFHSVEALMGGEWRTVTVEELCTAASEMYAVTVGELAEQKPAGQTA